MRFRKSTPVAGALLAGFVGMVATCLVADAAWGQAQYGSAREAYAAGAKLYNMRKYAECREPFEAALKLSDDLPFKVRIYRTLMQPYRQLPEIDKMLEATEFIFEHGESAVEKSLIARDLASFAHQRGKTEEIADRYEKRLKQAPEDRPALYTLTQLYDRAQPNPARRNELQLVLKKVQQLDEAELARKFENLAVAQPTVATRHWKDAAAAWLRAGERQNAIAATEKAEATGPESANDLLAHQWHRAMGDIYMGLDEPRKAIPHFEKAIEKTTIAGYLKDCKESLAKARAAAGL